MVGRLKKRKEEPIVTVKLGVGVSNYGVEVGPLPLGANSVKCFEFQSGSQ